MAMDPKTLEAVLKEHARQTCLEKVISADSKPAVGKGESYGSSISRVSLKVALGSGVVTKRSILVKNLPDSQPDIDFLLEFKAFSTEIEAYSNIFPHFERLMMDKELTTGRLWCKCFGYKQEVQIILEDLKVLGYKNAGRLEQLDLKHSLLVMRSLGRLHGMSAVLLSQGHLDKTRLYASSLARNMDGINAFLTSGVSLLWRTIKDEWTGDWEGVISDLQYLEKSVGQELNNLWKTRTNQLTVFNHGDCWMNNILFKYDEEEPILLKFVDFQECHYSTYGWDLTYFFSTSANPQVLIEHEDDLLGAYLKSLDNTFNQCGYIPDSRPGLEDIKKELRRLLPYALTCAVSITSYLLCNSEDTMELSEILSETEESQKKRLKIYTSQRYSSFIRIFLERYKKLSKATS